MVTLVPTPGDSELLLRFWQLDHPAKVRCSSTTCSWSSEPRLVALPVLRLCVYAADTAGKGA